MPLIKGSQTDTSSKLSYFFNDLSEEIKVHWTGWNYQSSGFFPSFQVGIVIIFSVFHNLRLMDNLGSPRTILWVFPSLLTVSSGVFVQSCCDLLTCWINKLFFLFSFSTLLALKGAFNLSGAMGWIYRYCCRAWCWIKSLPCLVLVIQLFPTPICSKSSRQVNGSWQWILFTSIFSLRVPNSLVVSLREISS